MPGSAKRQSLHIPAEPELSSRVTSKHEARLSAPGPPRPRLKMSDLLSARQAGLCPDVAEPDRRSASQVALTYSASRGTQNINRPKISQHGDQTITTILRKAASRLAVKHVTYHVYLHHRHTFY